MSDLGAFAVGAIGGLAIVGAVLLRNEDEVRKAWRQRRGGSTPRAGDTSLWMVVAAGLIASVNIGLGVADNDAFHVILGTLWLLPFYLALRGYRRSRSKQGATPAP